MRYVACRRTLLVASFFVLLCKTAAPAQTSAVGRVVTTIVDGIYVISHPNAPTGFPNGNTTVIIGDREVLVVDSCYLPSEAHKDIAQIRQWTNKPVRYVVNTHWHNDHVMGNSVYREAYASLAVIAHVETKKDMDLLIAEYPRRFDESMAASRQRLESGKAADGKPLTETEKAEAEKALGSRRLVNDEYKSIVYHSPEISFHDELNINLGNREVQIKYLGKGNTTGDAIVYLPRERVLVSGDLLVRPLPFTLDGYPTLWIQTLDQMARLDADVIVPGHGEVMRDKNHLYNVRDLLKSAVEQVDRQLRRIGPAEVNTVEQVIGSVDLTPFKPKFIRGDESLSKDFDGMADRLVRLVFKEAALR